MEPLDPPKGVPGPGLDQLFRAPESEFTAKRNELAKSLRGDGEAEAADWVRSLRKPSKAAWLVNQVAARKPKDVRRLLEVGEELRRAQEEMLAGAPDREKLRDAAGRERELIDSLLRTADAIGREHGVGSQILDRVGETLQAASSDPDVAEAIESGHLTKEQRSAGIGLAGAGTAAAAKPKRKGAGKAAAERKARERTARQRKAAERKLATAEKRVERERGALLKAREALAEREGRLAAAERDARTARRELDEL